MKKILLFLLFISNLVVAQKSNIPFSKLPEIVLWNVTIPSGPGSGGETKISATGSFSHIVTPKLLVDKPDHPNGIAILVIGGGGYQHIEIGKESHPTAQWLKSLGITVFELVYRLPKEGWGSNKVPFQDAQRAIRLIRGNAQTYQIDPTKIGVLGFSAGGHLAGYISSMFDTPFYEPQDSIDKISAQPNFSGLIYPVISMLPPNNKTNSYKNILGEDASEDQKILFSVDQQVNKNTPRTFLAQATDDPISPVENSILMFQALKNNQIPVEMHIFQTGGHGWGMGKKNTETTQWPKLFQNWLQQNNILNHKVENK